MVIKSLTSFTLVLVFNMYDKTSLPKYHDFRHLLGCDTIEYSSCFFVKITRDNLFAVAQFDVVKTP